MLGQVVPWLSDAANGWLGGPTFLSVTAGRWATLAAFAAAGWALGILAG